MTKRATERSAACATCGKTFARSDTLLRHEKSHVATEDRGPIHRVTNGTFRACSSCAQARSRCSGGVPCGRCKTRDLECVYPSKRRRGSAYDEIDVHQGPPSHFQQLVFPSTSTPSSMGLGQPTLEHVTSTPNVSHPVHEQISSQTPVQPQTQLHVAGHLDAPNAYHVTSLDTNISTVTGSSQHLSTPDHYDNSTSIGYPTSFENQNPSYGGQSMYDLPLNLNWLPLSVYPSPYGDIDQDFSFFLPSISDVTSMNTDLNSLALDTSLTSPPTRSDPNTTHFASTSHEPPPSISGLMQSPTSSVSNTMPPAGFSFDTVDIREPRKKRRKIVHVSAGGSPSKDSQEGYSFPDMSALSPPVDPSWCSEEIYASVLSTFQKLCVDPSRWTPFSTDNFPDQEAFTVCIELYFEHLHPSFPLFHAPTFATDADWLTCVATAAIGSTFATISQSADAREAFLEFLRRAVLTASEQNDGDFRNLHLAQARILALVGLTQSDREQLRSRAPRSHADIARWCLESSILQLTAPDEEVRSDEDIEAAWRRWVQHESLRRVGYFIWYLDCALGYICNARPLCNMDDARAPLPCPEALWNASTARKWLLHRNNTPPMPSLCAALETTYKKKKIEPELSEISHILLIHALYARTWEVGTHIKQPLSEWKATGDARGFLDTPSKDNLWLPLYPLYANWRNSACDCLDVLHWHANEVTARNAGAEHHAVLHLHLARIILLTPFQEIQDLLFFLINHRVSDLSKASFYVHDGSYQPRNPAKLAQIRRITWRWLREDQHKARLAVVHAGSVFWHVRRYSTNSFFEPLAIYLASIVLWTYGSYKSAALARDATVGQSSNSSNDVSMTTTAKDGHSQTSGQPDSIQIEQSNKTNVQPTRVERAALGHVDLKMRSSRSRSGPDQDTASTTDTNADNSPARPQPRNSHIENPPSQSIRHASSPHTDADSDRSSLSSVSLEEDEEEEDHPTFIHLDRPCDDEIVQHFVRAGHNMAGHMSHVGDICQTPARVLLEGAKILRRRKNMGHGWCWGVSREYHDVLIRLAGLRKDKGKDEAGDGNGHGHGNGNEA